MDTFPREKRKELIKAKCLKKTHHEPSFQGTDVKHRIDFKFRFANSYKKDIRAFAGNLLVKDLFDELVFTISMKVQDPIRANGTYNWEGGIEYNYFIQDQVKLNNLPLKDMKVEFVTKSVIFTDGTKQDYENS
ncbi:MAG: hypothetical protein WCR46_00075 [Deltaproteobacteria bacterium]